MRDWLSAVELEMGAIRRETHEARKALKPKRGPSKKANKRKAKPFTAKPTRTLRRVEKAAANAKVAASFRRENPPKIKKRCDRFAWRLRKVTLPCSNRITRSANPDIWQNCDVRGCWRRYAIGEVQHQVKNLDREYEKAKTELAERFGEPAPFRTHERDSVDLHEAFYEVKHTDQGLAIQFNRRHPMYDVYAHARDTNDAMWLFLQASFVGHWSC